MNRMMKTLMVILIIAYAVAPDPIPGPVDDVTLAVLGYILNRRVSTN